MEKMVNILADLKEIDTNALQRILDMMELCKGMMPAELMPAFTALRNDISLTLFFAAQAKEHDSTDIVVKIVGDMLKP